MHIFLIGLAALGISLSYAAYGGTITLDFEEFSNGDIVTASQGVDITIQERQGGSLVPGHAVIFDTSFVNEDHDLHESVGNAPLSAGMGFVPPGISTTPIGGSPNLVIIQNTRRTPIGSDGRAVPNDNHQGGIISFDFTDSFGDQGVTLESVALAEFSRQNGRADRIVMSHVGGGVTSFTIGDYIGDDRSGVVDFGELLGFFNVSPSGVARIDFELGQSGGVGNLTFSTATFSAGGNETAAIIEAPDAAGIALLTAVLAMLRRPPSARSA